MRKIILFFMLILNIATINAQEFGTSWITSPEGNDSSQIWFRRSYVTKNKPQKAFLSVATTGTVQIYVNERKVTGNILSPVQDTEGNKEEAFIIKFDITRFLRNDTNTIAVWYAPTNQKKTDKAISATYYGTNSKGSAFSYASDGTWLTKLAPGWNKGDEEGYDARLYDKDWKKATIDKSSWKYAFSSADRQTFVIAEKSTNYTTYKKSRLIEKTNSSVDSTGIKYTFGNSFTGQIRLTIRNAKAGTKFTMGKFTYICCGETDEQAFRRFSTETQKEVLITGENFKQSMIQNIEGIEIIPYIHNSYLY